MIILLTLLLGTIVGYSCWVYLNKKPTDSRLYDENWNPLEELLKGESAEEINREAVVEWLYETARRGEWELNDGDYRRVEHFSHKEYDMQVTEEGGDDIENVFRGMMKGDFGYYSLFTEKEVKKLRQILVKNREETLKKEKIEAEKRKTEYHKAKALEELKEFAKLVKQ